MCRNISTLIWFLCIICCESGLRHDLPRSLRIKVGRSLADFRLHCRSDDETKSPDESEIVVESSTKALSKYETRSRLLEAALQSTRIRQSELDATNLGLKKEINELNLKFELSDKGSSQIIEELERSRSELQAALKLSASNAILLEKAQQEEKKERNMEIVKYKNRLILLEKAYRESQIALREEMDDAVEKDAIRLTQSIQIAELLEEIVQLKSDVEVLTLDFLKEKRFIMAGRDRQELVIEEFKRKEMKRNEDDKVASAKSIKAASEPVKIAPSETFSEFLKKNEIEKVLEDQRIQQRFNENILEQQRLVLTETIRLLSVSASEKRRIEKEREEESEKKKVDLKIASSVTEQLRLLQRQTEILETLKNEILVLNSSLITYMKKGPRINNFDDDIRSAFDTNDTKTKKFPRQEIEITRVEYMENDGIIRDVSESPKSENSRNEVLNENKKTVPSSPEVIENEKVEIDEKGEEEDEEDEKEDRVNMFFSRVANLIAPPDNNNGNDNDGNDDNGDDVYKVVAENKPIRKTKIGSAQQKRVKLARTTGKALRNVGRNLMKSASDALGFWVGLGFDEIEIEGEGETDVEIVDKSDIEYVQQKSRTNKNQIYTSLPSNSDQIRSKIHQIPDIIETESEDNESLRSVIENNSIVALESTPKKITKSPFYVQNSIKKNGMAP